MIETDQQLECEKITNGLIASINGQKTHFKDLMSLVTFITGDVVREWAELNHYSGQYVGCKWKVNFQITEIKEPCNETNPQ